MDTVGPVQTQLEALPPKDRVVWRTTAARVSLSIAAGALLGGALTAPLWPLFAIVNRIPASEYSDRDLPGLWIGATIIWLIGIAIPGGAMWAWLHGRGRNDMRTALRLGAVLPPLALLAVTAISLAVSGHAQSLAGLVQPAALAAAVSLIGTAVSFVVWRIAYRRDATGLAAAFS